MKKFCYISHSPIPLIRNSVKYLLLIILSILLLSSPVIGNSHKVKTLYGWGECCDWVWKGFGDKETQSVYKGDVRDGEPYGLGVMTYKDGRKYEGNWKNGIWNGKGKYSFNDGFGYEGEWKNGVENGMGTLTYPNGDKYIGQFKNGKMMNGKMYKKNGDIHTQENGKWRLENR
jgi:hypothetical protein